MKRIAFAAAAACVLLCNLNSAWGAVGRTAASFGTSPSGAAQYSIPIFAPPGTAGMTPAISLMYSSNVGDALAGMGFTIGGLSQIERCNRTMAQDGVASAPDLSGSDRFCLDGVQLKYDSSTATYRTELESFARITVSVNANGPQYFIVEQKNGLIYEYGNSDHSRIESLRVGGGQVATARAWALNKIRDRAGNSIEFEYEEDANYGAFRPSEIRWTSNPGQGLAAAYKIAFVYEAAQRPDILYGYRFGNPNVVDGQVTETKRLDRVDVTYNGAIVRRYELSYDGGGAGARSRLQSIQECGVGGSDCFSPTQLTWINGQLSWSGESSTGQSVPTAPIVMDINNDGRDDLVYSTSATSGSGQWAYMLANTSGGYNSAVNTGYANTNFTDAHPFEWDGDGRTDFLVPYSGNTWWVFRANGSGFDAPINTQVPYSSGQGSQWWAADIDGDGRGDLIHIGGGVEIYARLNVGGGFSSTETLISTIALDYNNSGTLKANALHGYSMLSRSATKRPDFDGDGREDFVVEVYAADDPELSPPPLTATTYLCVIEPRGLAMAGGYCIPFYSGLLSHVTALEWFMGDANGDGLTDLYTILSEGTPTARVSLSRGYGYYPGVSSTSFAGYTAASAVAADWDGDGLDDLIAPASSGALGVSRATGTSLSGFVAAGATSGTGNFASVGDMNGDGLPDLMRSNPSNNAWMYATHLGVQADMLNVVTDGYGNTVDFDYVSIAQSNHTPAASATYPEQVYQRPRYVVSQYSASNGVGGTYSMSYQYYGALTHVKGLGFEGFARRRVLDSRTGLYAHEYYKQLFPLTGAVDKTELYQGDNATLISRVQNTWSSYTYGSSWETRALPYVSGSTATRYEVGGTYNGFLISTAQTTNSVDSTTGTQYDSTTVSTEASSANGINSGQTSTQRTWHSALFTNTATWCIGRPSTTQQINSHTMYGGAQLTRTVDTTWDAAMCRPTQLVSQQGDWQWQVTTALGYDVFGNVSSQSVTGAGMGTRTASTYWDVNGQFPKTLTNALSQTTTNVWNFALGVQTSQTDPNGITVGWQYDNFGRKFRENRPDSTATTWAYNDCASSGCVNSNNKMVIVATELNTSGGTIRDDYTYLDKFDRVLVGRSQTLSGAYNRVDREYDAQGRLYRQSATCWWGSCTNYWTTYTYDVLNRLKQASRPVSDSDPTLQASSIAYEGLTTRTTDALNKQSTKIASAIGQLARSTDHDGYYQTFDYDAFGNPVRVTDSAGNTLQSSTYNINGALLTRTDMDRGTWTYVPNALGEVQTQRDAKTVPAEWTTFFTYDALGRLTTRNDGDGLMTWTWGDSAAAHNIGRLASMSISPGVPWTESYQFDAIGRPTQTTYIGPTSDVTYAVNTAYNATTGFVDTLTYPESTSGYRLRLKYEYAYGHSLRVRDDNDSTVVFWEANATDARGAVIDEVIGKTSTVPAGLHTINGVDAVTGRVDSINTITGTTTLQDLSYAWDKVGNLASRQNHVRSLTENFYYDNLHRLDYSTLNGTTNEDLSYDALGNITSKLGTGTYTYDSVKRHQVTSITGPYGTWSYVYDANGSMTSRNGGVVQWYRFGLPKSIALADNSSSATFNYGPDGRRVREIYSANGSGEAVYYIGSLLEKRISADFTDWRHFIYANGKPVGLYRRMSTGSNLRAAVLTDHLGSTDMVVFNTNPILRESFAAFGSPRDPNFWVPGWSSEAQARLWTRRGFTFHEHLNGLGIIHMNGRVYDPMIGRFLSADPFISDPTSTQDYNRYSYVNNNPLSFTDPSGFQTLRDRFASMDENEIVSYRDWMRDVTTQKYNFGLFLAETLGGSASFGGFGGIGGNFDFGPSSGVGACWSFACTGNRLLTGFVGGGRGVPLLESSDDYYQRTDPIRATSYNGGFKNWTISILVDPQNMEGGSSTPISISSGWGGDLANYLPGAGFAGCMFSMSSSNACGFGQWLGGIADVIPGEAVAGVLGRIAGRGLTAGMRVNMPAWRKIVIDMEEVASGHMVGGSRLGPGSLKDMFPESMSATQVERAIRSAYRNGEVLGSQGDRVFVRGPFEYGSIEMWVNKTTKTIETAWPKF